MRPLTAPRAFASRFTAVPLIAASVVASFLVGEGRALADDKAECVASYDKSQAERKKGALRSAKKELLVCAADRCPQVVKGQCADWLEEVDKSIPTVSFAVTDEQGKDLGDVMVSFDGEVVQQRLDGKAVAVDPGPHKFRFESAGRKPIELEVTVREGDKARQIEATWKSDAKVVDHGTGATPGEPTDQGGVKKLSPAFWVLGGAGVLGFGLFATFGGLGLSEKSKDEGKDGCAPKCTDDEVSSIKTKFLVADVSLAVGAASLAAATIVGVVTLVSGPSKPKPASETTTSFSIVPVADPRRGATAAPVGGVFGLTTTF